MPAAVSGDEKLDKTVLTVRAVARILRLRKENRKALKDPVKSFDKWIKRPFY